MSRAVTPELALAYLRELSSDVRAARVRDGEGRVLAGDAELAGEVVAGRAGGVEVGLVLGARSLPVLARHDAGVVARALAAEASRA